MILSVNELLEHLKLNPKTSGFIVFEGINGGGKSTLISGCAEYLRSQKREFICTREPGGTPLGKELRRILLERKDIERSEFAEMMLFSADRTQHIEEVILPALASGTLVLCDRYLYSTTAFQGYGRGIDLSFIESCHRLATRGLEPDFVVLLDLDVQQALLRADKRASSEKDVFEDEEVGFHNKVREGFLKQAAESQTPFLVLDATMTPKELTQQVCALLSFYTNISLSKEL